MKPQKPNRAIVTALGIFALFTVFSTSAAAADFNPQPDPPGKSKTLTDGQNHTSDHHGKQIPAMAKSDKSSDTRMLLPAVKPVKAIPADPQKVGATQDVKN